MIKKTYLLLVVTTSLTFAQDPASNATAPAPKAERAVRRFSAGGVLSISGLNLMQSGNKEQSSTNLLIESSNQPGGFRLGGGVVAQFAWGDRWAVAGSVLLRRVKFDTTTTTYTGVDNPNTTTDERKKNVDLDTTKSSFGEFPVVVRRYSQDHDIAGRRWFYEGGVAFRRATGVNRFRETTTSDNKTVCCDEVPLSPANRLSTGVVVGAGFHFVDQFGLRIIPEIRFVRWLNRSFDFQSARSSANQLEAGVSFTF